MKNSSNKILLLSIIGMLITGGITCIFYYRSYYSYKPDNSNKSLTRSVEYKDECGYNNDTNAKIFHVSIDDTIEIFKDLSNNSDVYSSIFQNETLEWSRTLHNKYGTCFTFYVYYEDQGFNISQLDGKYRKEFEENSDWLRFGFHSYNKNRRYDSDKYNLGRDYSNTIESLIKIVGEKSIDNVIRLHAFAGSYDQIGSISNIKIEPVIGLLTSDDIRLNYYLDKKSNDYIYCHDRYRDNMPMNFFSSDLRIEFIDNIDEKIEELATPVWNNQLGDLIVFSHEWKLSDEDVRNKLIKICEYASQNGYNNIFIEDNISE